MSINEKANVHVDIDGKEAGQQLERLQAEAKAFRKEMQELKKSGKPVDPKYYDELKNKIRDTEREMKQYKKQITDVAYVVKNLSSVSQNELLQAKRKLINEIKKSSRATAEERIQLEQKKKQLQLVSSELDKLSLKQKESGSSFGNLANGFNKYMGIMAAASATFLGVVLGFRKIVDIANEFEERVDYLSSLTGLAGAELDWLTEKAKETSVSTVEFGVRIRSSAKDIVDAYTTMGSARPELLKNKEDLAQVTEKALILAEAAKMQAAPAIDAVAAAMNQFNLPASEASRIINTFAAGSLAGSAEVNHLTESLANAGTVADDSNMSLEQTVAVLEVLGEKQLKGAEAGTMLRSALMKMKAAGVGYQSGMFNLRDALVEVNEKLAGFGSELEKDTYKQEVFGERSITVGTILLNNISTYDNLTKAVTGTNTAFEQAATNTDNNATKLEQARNKYQLLAIELGNRLAPAITFSTNGFSYLMKAIMGTIRIFEEYGAQIKAITTGLLAYGIAINAELILTKLFTAATWLAQKAILAFNWAIKQNPLALLAGVLATVASYLLIFRKNTDEAKESVDKLKQSIVWTNKNFDLFIKKMEFLKGRDAFKWVKVSLEDFKKSLKNLDLQNLESMKAFLQNKVAESIRELANATDDVSRAQAEQKKLDYQKYLAAVNDELGKAEEIVKEIVPVAPIKFSEGWKLEGERALAYITQLQKDIEDRLKKFGGEEVDFFPEDEEEIADEAAYLIKKFSETYEGRKAIIEDFHKSGLISTAEYNDQIFNLEVGHAEKLIALEQEKNAARDSFLQKSIDTAAQLLKMASDAQFNKDMHQLDLKHDAEIQKLQQRYDQGLISKEAYDVGMQKLQMDHDKKELQIKQKQAKREKLMEGLEVGVNAIKAIAKIKATAAILLANPITAPLAAVSLAQIPWVLGETALALGLIAAKPIPQFYAGNTLGVFGKDDGKYYNAKQGRYGTQLVNGPTLIPGIGLTGEGKRPKELIFSGEDTYKIMNTPRLVDDIRRTISGSPQFAAGNYPKTVTNNTYEKTFTDPLLLTLLQKLDQRLNEPIRTELVANENYLRTHNKKQAEYEAFKNRVG